MTENETGVRSGGKRVRVGHRAKVRAPRRKVQVPARLQFPTRHLECNVLDLSYTGMYIQVYDDLPPVGTQCEVILELPDGRLRAKGKVSRIDVETGRFALDLTHLGRSAYLVLAALLADIGTGGPLRKARKL